MAALSPAAHVALLAELAAQVRRVRADLMQFPVLYYFRPRDARFALPAALPVLERLAAQARQPAHAGTAGVHGALLDAALADLAELLDHHFVRPADHSRGAIFAAYAADHRQPC